MQAQQVLRQRFPGMEVVPSTYPVSPQKASCIPVSTPATLSDIQQPGLKELQSSLLKHSSIRPAHPQRGALGAAGELNTLEGPRRQSHC